MKDNHDMAPSSLGEGRGESAGVCRRLYSAPNIEIINNVYGEGLMDTLSILVSTTPTTSTGDSKPSSGDWGDVWDVQNSDHTWE